MNRKEIIHSLMVYNQPKLAIAAVASLLFVAAIALPPIAHIEKAGFLLGTSAGLYFVLTGGKAMRNQFGNLAILFFITGLTMIAMGILATPVAAVTGNNVEDMIPHIVAGIGTIFSNIEDTKTTKRKKNV